MSPSERRDQVSKKAIKKHDRDDDVQRRIREFKNAERYDEWTPCEMYGHEYFEGACRDCGDPQEG
jgi:hypothetical protein